MRQEKGLCTKGCRTCEHQSLVLWESLICSFGFPKRIHSEQGANFESELVKELCTLAGVKSRTTPYHPWGNPVERFNRTLLDLLGTLSDKKKEHWRKYVHPLVHAYNCTRNDATGESPFLSDVRTPTSSANRPLFWN